MNPPEAIRLLLFAVLFYVGRCLSCLIYQACWNNAIGRDLFKFGAFATLLTRPALWFVHVPVLWLTLELQWQSWPILHLFCASGLIVVAIAAIGRFGPSGQGTFFLIDRLLLIALTIGACFLPVLLYPALLCCCCLQYSVSRWGLGPGYSNLLGFEFMRGSLCVLLACFVGHGLLTQAGITIAGFEPIAIAVVLGYQASIYAYQALAKSALGPKWYAWPMHNRVQCLLVNAYLRGWRSGRSEETVLKQASRLARWRRPLCWGAWAMELGWLGVLLDHRIALLILCAALVFHLMVTVWTGLLCVAHVVNAAVWMIVIAVYQPAGLFGWGYALVLVGCVVACWPWVALIHSRSAAEIRRDGAPTRWGRCSDAADLLMAWWDSPYMRQFSYSVHTADGREMALPVTCYSPHDTALTDIHTHLMFLDLHQGLDPCVPDDRQTVKAGVWGLLREIKDRDLLYTMMDEPSSDLSFLTSKPHSPPWLWTADHPEPADAEPLAMHMLELNRHQPRGWFRRLM
ncbi:MAG: hypothetical protein AAF085_09625, partial [Planctomycetota bacterium]